MPLPGNVGTGRVYGTFTNDDGSSGVGVVSFIPPVDVPVLLDASANVVVVLNQLDVRLDEDGHFDVDDLIATDDPDLNPNDWMWLVRVKLAGKAPYHFYIDMPEGSFRNIADIAGVPSFTNPQIVALPGIPGPEVDDGNKGDIEIIDGRWMIGLYTTEDYNLRAGGTDHWTVEAGSKVGWFDPTTGSFFLGQNLIHNLESGDGGQMMPDFVWDGPGLRLRVRNITMAMIADPADMNMQRYGPGSGGFPYGSVDPPYSFDNLTGLGIGSLVSDLRATPALVPHGGDQDTPGAKAQSTGAAISYKCVDMPRVVTADGQHSVEMCFEFNVAPRMAHDFRETAFRIGAHNLRMGIKGCEIGDQGAIVQIAAHEGETVGATLTAVGIVTGGNFQLIYYPVPPGDDDFSTAVNTANIVWNTSAATVQAALEAVPEIGVGGVTCSGGPLPGTPITCTFAGAHALTNQFRMGRVNNLTGTGANLTVGRVNRQGLVSEADRDLLWMKHTSGNTGTYITIKDGANADVLVLDSAKKLELAGEIEIDGALNHDGSTAGFMGATPVVRQTVGAAATDAATTQTLANNLRTALINLGLGQT